MFYEELEKRGLSQLILGTPFKKVLPKGAKEFRNAIRDIIENNRSVYLDEDCDIDGYLSVLTLKTMFDVLGFKNYTIPTHVYKRHGVSSDTINMMLREEQFDYYIITDSTSSDTGVFDAFLAHPESKCICIDHHPTSTDRDRYCNSNVLLINPKIDANEKGEKTLLYDLSACAICALLVDMAVKSLYPEKYDDLKGAHWIYGYITLYSDSCNFSWYNIAYARRVVESHYPYPPIVNLFMNQYSTLNRTFVSWTLAPRLNALLRAEYFSIAYDLFYNIEKIKEEGTLKFIEQVYQDSKVFVQDLAKSTTIVEKENLVVGYLEDVARARNYTGLVASDLASQYNKPCMILLQTTSGTYEGSVRDLYNRNLLDIFKSCIQAEGHGPAFGVKIDKKDIEDNIYILDNLLSEIQDNNTGIILLDWSMYNSKDKELLEDIQLMAEYNEYSGQGLPCAYAKLPIKTNMTIKRYPNVTRIYWGNMHELVLFGRYISQGDTAIVSPSYPNRLIIKNIIYKY